MLSSGFVVLPFFEDLLLIVETFHALFVSGQVKGLPGIFDQCQIQSLNHFYV
jgi:hypothetical protein